MHHADLVKQLRGTVQDNEDLALEVCSFDKADWPELERSIEWYQRVIKTLASLVSSVRSVCVRKGARMSYTACLHSFSSEFV